MKYYKCKECGSKWRTKSMLSDDNICINCKSSEFDMRKLMKPEKLKEAGIV